MQRTTLGIAITLALGASAAVAADQAAGQAPASASANKAAGSIKAAGTGSPAAKATGASKAPLAAPPVPTAKPAAAATAAPAKKPEPELTVWSPEEISLATARCNALLKGVDAVVMPEPAFRSGSCGAPAPVRVISIGRNPEVSISPAPVLTCDMVVGLATWIKNDLQPLARKHLGEPVIAIHSMSDYSCRAAYGRVGNKLSEHGRANALDIRGFVTAKGQPAMVLSEWGKTARDIKREVAAAKAAADKAEQERLAAEQGRQQPAAATPPHIAADVKVKVPASVQSFATGAVDAVTSIVKNTIIEGTPAGGTAPGKAPQPAITESFAPPMRLGGSKQEVDGAPAGGNAVVISSRKSRFLREAHDAACRIFGTTLGPEANEAHRNHLHVDMAERSSGKYCE